MSKEQGMKNDRADGKLMYELVPIEPIEALADIMTYGAQKYAPNNWQNVEQDRYYAALLRHVFAWRKGETYDSESGRHHLGHALTNLAFMLWQDIHIKGKKLIK
jgi:hypothetical protein